MVWTERKSMQKIAQKELDTHSIQNDYEVKCKICNDRGFVVTTKEDAELVEEKEEIITTIIDGPDGTTKKKHTPTGVFNKVYTKKCICKVKSDYMYRLTAGGMSNFINHSFNNFITKFKWQEIFLNSAKDFRKDPTQLFFMSGIAGSGKTRLCSTLANYLVYKGYSPEYLLWEREMAEATDNYRAIDFKKFSMWSSIPLLYIDDFLKCMDNDINKLTDLEKRTARAIINARYNNPKLITIISTELTDVQLERIDRSLFSRLKEMATSKYLHFMDPKDTSRDIRHLKFIGEWPTEEIK